MACLDNIVAVKGCGVTGAGAWVNHLPGLSVMDFEKAISNEHKSAIARLQELIAQGTEEAVAEIRTALGASFELLSFVESDTIGAFADDMGVEDAIAGYKVGVQAKIQGEPYMAFHISKLRLFVDYDGAVDVKVWDAIQNTVLDTISVTAVAGEVVSVEVNKTYYTSGNRLNLFIGYTSSFDSYETELHRTANNCWDGCGYSNEHVYFKAAKVTGNVINTNLESISHTGGLSFDYSLQCSFDEHLCNIRNLLAQPILYKVGALIAREMRFSKRLTGAVTVYKEDHVEMEKEYTLIYQDKFAALMKNQRMKESACFSCKKKVYSTVMLP